MGDETAAKKYHEWYYDNKIWETTSFLGADCLKSVSDMWNYQEILCRLRPSLIIEFGTYRGGATLYFSTILKAINDRSLVLTVDIAHDKAVRERLSRNGRIKIMTCSSTDPLVAREILALRRKYKGPAFFILDSDHSQPHVLAEMESLRPVTRAGDYLIVEDSNINGNPVLPGFGPGPMEAIREYFGKYPADYVRDSAAEKKFGFTFAPEGFLIRQ